MAIIWLEREEINGHSFNDIENLGIKVGAISPMNISNNLKAPSYFIPDPWTETSVSGGMHAKWLHQAVSKMVNANAGGKLDYKIFLKLLLAALKYAQVRNYYKYGSLALGSLTGPWRKALFLDRLLADVFIHEQSRSTPMFSTLFLNAGAHIQHHYLFNSVIYDGEKTNPDWYVKGGEDPVYEVYQSYDEILGDIQTAFPESRLMVITALHQDPYPDITYYWRLKNHEDFLNASGISFEKVEPRMSRDFLIRVKAESEAHCVERILNEAKFSGFQESVFTVDNRGKSLFVTLSWPNDVSDNQKLEINGLNLLNFRKMLGFVAIKNGHHNPTGYLIDTMNAHKTNSLPIHKIYQLILSHFGI